MPGTAPTPDGEVRTQGTVLEAPGSASGGPELCFAVAESYPPQCGGIPIRGWSWKQVARYTEQASDVRWGTFALTGTYDGDVFTLTQEAIPLALYDPMVAEPPVDPLATRCPEPEGGWQPVDRSTTTSRSLSAVLRAAENLDGLTAVWIDQGQAPGTIEPQGEAIGDLGANDPSNVVVNVVVTGAPAEAEVTLRELWGGPLCITRSAHDAASLEAIRAELEAVPDLSSAVVELDVVAITVTYDDGSLQRWADETYGAGTVRVDSLLQPVG